MNEADVKATASWLVSRLEEDSQNSVSAELNAMPQTDRLAVAKAMQEYNEKHRNANPTLPRLEIYAVDGQLIDMRLSKSEKVTDIYDRPKMPNGTEVVGEKSPQGSFDRHDPYRHIEQAHQLLLEMKTLEKEPRNKPITVLDERGSTTMTVRERLKELRQSVGDAYEQAITTAEQLNAGRARDLIAALDEAIVSRTKANNDLDIGGDLFAATPATDTKSKDEDERFMSFSLPELLVLREKVLEKISAQTICNQLYATLLADEGNLTEAKKHADAAAHFGRFDENPVLSSDVKHLEHLLRRQELAGEDPLELLRLAERAKQCGDGQEAMIMDERAVKAASMLDYAALNRQLDQVKEALKQAAAGEKFSQLTRDKDCLEELLHAKAAVDLKKAQRAAAEGDFTQTQKLLAKIAEDDQIFVVENFEDFLNLTLMTNSKGNAKNVFEFHEHLLTVQKFLGNPSCPPEEINRHLELARDCANRLPQQEIGAIKAAQESNLNKLEDELKACTDEHRPRLEELIQRSRQHLADLALLEHAPAHVELLNGILELSVKNTSSALASFEQIEKDDPEFAQLHKQQLDRLKEMTRVPVTDENLRLCLEAAYTTTAILAGTLACLATSVSGPAALAVGAGAGMLARTALKATMEGTVNVSDPIFGALDGLGAAAGLKTAERTLSALSGSTKSVLAAERALAATSASSEALDALRALQNSQRFIGSYNVARDGLAAMRSQVSLTGRLASHLGFGGDAALAYRQAARATSQLGRILARNQTLAAFAGGTMAGALRQTRPLAYRLYNGDYDNAGDLTAEFAQQTLGEAMKYGLYGALSGPINPFLVRDLTGAATAGYRTHSFFDEKKLSGCTDELYSQSEARMRYLLLPGERPNVRRQKDK